MNRAALIALALTLNLSFAACCAAAQAGTRAKKLIEYGWDVPTPAFVRAHIREMEQRPFDGLIMRLPNMGNVFTVEQWDSAQFAAALDDLRNVAWDTFTDNFIIMWSASTMDWFSDADWEVVSSNAGLIAEAAVAGRCKGVCFDFEPYGANPWVYAEQARHSEKSFAEYQAQARKRGAQFMRAVADVMPNAVIHTFFLLSLFPDIAAEHDAAKRAAALARHPYGLLPAFINGLLDAAPPGVTITDGNEVAYYYTDPLAFDRARDLMREGVLSLVARENLRKYERQVQVSQALYVDQVFKLRQGITLVSSALSPRERARLFEHNTYYALATAEEYVWCYSERMNWWDNRDIPPGLEAAIKSARRKIAAGRPLGFDLSEQMRAAETRLRSEMESKLIRRTGTIRRRAADVPVPVIDGKLDDPIWRRTEPLEPFVLYVGSDSLPQAATRCRVTYDETNLYVAFDCDEPQPDAMRILGSARDDTIWLGDTVEVFLSAADDGIPFVHFILSPRNVQWDAYTTAREEGLKFNPKWRSATVITGAGWCAEMSLPWKEIRIRVPAPGTRLRANVCRQRTPGAEHSTWSQVVDGFVAPQYFGEWVFE